jgi:hypothetical protein
MREGGEREGAQILYNSVLVAVTTALAQARPSAHVPSWYPPSMFKLLEKKEARIPRSEAVFAL